MQPTQEKKNCCGEDRQGAKSWTERLTLERAFQSEHTPLMTTAISAAAAASAKVTIAGKITFACKFIASTLAFARFGNNRQQAAHARAVALLTNNVGVRILVACQQIKAGVTIMAIILIERHRNHTYLSWKQRLVQRSSLFR